MRKFLICTTFLLVATSSFCQQTDYLQKSKKQKTAAWVLLGGGFVVAVGGAILDASSDWTKSETPYFVAMGIGCASMIGSIPLFIVAGKNKKKGMNTSAYFEIQHSPVPANTGIAIRSMPALSVRIKF